MYGVLKGDRAGSSYHDDEYGFGLGLNVAPYVGMVEVYETGSYQYTWLQQTAMYGYVLGKIFQDKLISVNVNECQI